jgi:hypothetical protein
LEEAVGVALTDPSVAHRIEHVEADNAPFDADRHAAFPEPIIPSGVLRMCWRHAWCMPLPIHAVANSRRQRAKSAVL